MGYVKKQTYDGGSAPLQEGDNCTRLKEYTENNYGELAGLINGDSDYLEDLNFSASAGIHESKIVGAINNHPHHAGTNLGERTIGDRQLAWDQLGSEADYVRGGVYLMRTFRPGVKALWGVTQIVTGRAQDELTYNSPNNVVLRVPFTTVDGLSCPFSPGAVVQVQVTPQIPPGTSDDTTEYFDGVDRLILGSDNRGFDLWVCTENMDGKIYIFTYAAVGWEVI